MSPRFNGLGHRRMAEAQLVQSESKSAEARIGRGRQRTAGLISASYWSKTGIGGAVSKKSASASQDVRNHGTRISESSKD